MKLTFKKFFETSRQVSLLESEMLDISILNIEKAKKRIQSLLTTPVIITEKTDGIKLTVIRTNTPLSSNWRNNWIVAYKGNVVYPEDFEHLDDETAKRVKQHSIGISQFKFVFDKLKAAQQNLKISEIPEGTELFFEFLIKKPTLTREYKTSHELILLASSPTTYKEEFGRLTTNSQKFDVTKRHEFAKILSVKTPAVLFKGKLSDILKNTTSPDAIITELKERFLSIPSEHGGTMEGIVMEFDDGTFLKIIQDDQHSKEVRQKIKQKHAPQNPEAYYQKIIKLSEDALEVIGNKGTLKELLTKLSLWIYSKDHESLFQNLDPKKTDINAKDDVLLTAKARLLKKLPGNNNALFIGRFSPLTIAHYNIISNALNDYDHVVVNIVKAKIDEKNPFPTNLQKEMLNRCFGNSIEIIITETGNLLKSIQKSSKTINVVLAGSDRYDTYKQQLQQNRDVTVKEIQRTDDVSGTKVRNSIKNSDLETFKQNTPSQLWSMFEELKKYINSIH